MAETSLKNFQEVIGYQFREPQLLLEALTHSSYIQENSVSGRDNERMEFLGDAVLNLLVSVRLADTFPEFEEGDLSRARASLVATTHLAKVAARLDLGDYLRLGRGEEKTGGRAKKALLVDALEAVLAAIYRDGGLEPAGEFVERFILPSDLKANSDDLFSIDYKSALQEHLQAERLGMAAYRVVSECGPEHRKTFTIEVSLGPGLLAKGSGESKKSAEQQAAKIMLERLGVGTEAHG